MKARFRFRSSLNSRRRMSLRILGNESVKDRAGRRVEMPNPSIPQRFPVAILLHADGFAQVFAPRDHVDVQFSIVPAVQDVANEALALELAERQLPKKFREVITAPN